MFKLVIINDNYLHVISYNKFQDAIMKFDSIKQNAYLEIYKNIEVQVWFPKKKSTRNIIETYLEIISEEYNKANSNELFWCRKMSKNKLLDIFIRDIIPRNIFNVNDIYIDKILSDKEFRSLYI